MKQIYLHILVAAVAALTLAACDKEDVEPEAGRDYPAFSATIGGEGSRAFDTTWGENDRIGIYVKSGNVSGGNVSGGGANNLSHITKAGDGVFEVEDPDKQIIFTDNGQVGFIAYYPYCSTLDSKGIISTYKSTNIDQAKQKDFDFLWAEEAYGSKAAPDVKFKFSHRMCKISIVFMKGDDDTDVSSITEYSLGSLYLRGTFDPKTGECVKYGSTKSSPKVDLSNENVEEGEPVTPVIVFPQTLSSTSLAITITTPETGATLKGNLIFKEKNLLSGNNYRFVIKVSKTGLSIGDATIKPWNSKDLEDKEAS